MITLKEMKGLLNAEIRCSLKHEKGCGKKCEECELYDESKQKDIEEMWYELMQKLNSFEMFALHRYMCTMEQRDKKCDQNCADCAYAEKDHDEMFKKLVGIRTILQELME